MTKFEHVLDPLDQLNAIDGLGKKVVGTSFHGPFDVAL